MFDVMLKGDGEYVMDVWVQDKLNVLDIVVRFVICCWFFIDFYIDDIDVLIEFLKF